MAKRLLIAGKVQGVGYRMSFAQTASALGLGGWVRNLHDGSVEACVHGSDDLIATMVGWARRGPPAAQVTNVSIFDSDEQVPEHQQFDILPTR